MAKKGDYNDEVVIAVIKQVLEGKKTKAALSDEYGITTTGINYWLKKLRIKRTKYARNLRWNYIRSEITEYVKNDPKISKKYFVSEAEISVKE